MLSRISKKNMNNKKTIEEQLSQMTHKSVRLSEVEKQAIFSQVRAAGAIPVPQPPRKMPWWHIAAPISAIGAVVFVTMLILNPPSEQSTQVATGESPVPAQPVPVPTPQPTPIPEPTPESPSSILGYVYGDVIAEAPSVNGYVLAGLIGGSGGSGPDQDQQKEISFSTELSGAIPQARQYTYGLSDTQMQAVANIIGKTVFSHNGGSETLLSTLKKNPFRNDCIQLSREEKLTEPCIMITSAGFINVQYPVGKGISVDEGKRIMSEILAVSVDDIAQTPIQKAAIEQKISNWSFIALHVPQTVALDLPYKLPVWYVGSDNEEVISLIGNAFAIDTENSIPLELISEQEAAARLEENVKNIQSVPYTFGFRGATQTEADVWLEGELVYDITSVKLLYRQFLSNKGKRTLMPIYEFTGTEINNDHPVTFYVDATKQGKITEQQTLIGDM